MRRQLSESFDTERGGKARMVLSPILDQRDWEALRLGEEARFDDALRTILAERVRDLQSSLATDTLNALAWMIADQVLDVRFAVIRARDYPGNYHDKVAVYTDENGDSVALHGSLNDSIQGSLNGEAYSVFKSWEDGQRPYLMQHKTRLEILWNDQNSQFRIRCIPDAVREQIVHLRSTAHRPYSLPKSVVSVIHSLEPHCSVELNRKLGTQIYSFPMKYIPLDAKDRTYVGKHWNRRLLRGVQCILLATRGKVGTHLDFFEAAFGRTPEEFIEIALMPERYIIHRRRYENDGALEWREAFRALSAAKKTEFMRVASEPAGNTQENDFTIFSRITTPGNVGLSLWTRNSAKRFLARSASLSFKPSPQVGDSVDEGRLHPANAVITPGDGDCSCSLSPQPT